MQSRRLPLVSLAASRRIAFAALVSALGATTGCAETTLSAAPTRSPVAAQWVTRARSDYAELRVADARDAVAKALAAAPDDRDARLLGARVALTSLEFDEALRLLEGVDGLDASALRGRAHWGLGHVAEAADELEASLGPEVRDEWAKGIIALARRGQGRTPYAMSGGPLAVLELAHVSPVAPYIVVPVELDGEQVLAVVSTQTDELVVDGSSRAEPAWVSLRFGGRIELGDVPALTRDLSGLKRELNAPVKALLGMAVLRRIHATIDYAGHQFVARSYAAPPPPNATRIELRYAPTSAGVAMSSGLGESDAGRATLLLDSIGKHPLVLDEAGLAKAGVATSSLVAVPSEPDAKLREGEIATLRLGAFDLRRVPAILGVPVEPLEQSTGFGLDGVLGAPVLASYRLTISDEGRTLWLEDDILVRQILASERAAAESGRASPGPAPEPSSSSGGSPR